MAYQIRKIDVTSQHHPRNLNARYEGMPIKAATFDDVRKAFDANPALFGGYGSHVLKEEGDALDVIFTSGDYRSVFEDHGSKTTLAQVVEHHSIAFGERQ
ncbi:hypothetical protein ISE1_2715 [plant metagenome]|uniref:Uncharacterized protein n=1 Tax=plant metagenome TaxID=1297885 RepID=A0A484U4B2_9ZZZZ